MASKKVQDMDDFFFDEENAVIDVAASAYFKNQTASYNEAYKKWRRRKNNPYAFNFVDDTREHTYKDGVGFIRPQPGTAERAALYRNMNTLGLVLIGTLLLYTFGTQLFVRLTSLFGTTATFDFLNGLCGATEEYILLCLSVVRITGTLFAILCLLRCLKLPVKIVFPMEVMQRDMHRSSLPFVLMFMVLLNYLMHFFNLMLDFFGIKGGKMDFFIPQNPWLIGPAFLLQIILLPVLMELLVHGVILQSLRQFGDSFALLISSGIFALMYHDWTILFYAFLLSLMTGYFVLRTGSLITGFAMHSIVLAQLFIMELIRRFIEPDLAQFLIYTGGFVLISVGFLMLFAYNKNKTKLLTFRMQKTYISVQGKVLYSLSTIPVMLWLIWVFVLSVGNIQFKG